MASYAPSLVSGISKYLTDLMQNDDGLVFLVDEVEKLFLLLSPLQ
jgi:hypothetical protein